MTVVLKPQKGPQEEFLKSPADIVIYGGAAGGGKTYALLMECARHVTNKYFRAVIFRRTSGQIKNPGGLFDTACEIYPGMGAKPYESPHVSFKFPNGAKILMTHLQYDKDAFAWQGSQVPLVCYDELTHFTEKQFFYLVSRGRATNGTAGIRPYVRATCNPDPDSFVAKLISWWIDQDTGLAIPKRSGVIRYFIRVENELVWGDSVEELVEKYGSLDENGNQTCLPKSLTFISSSISDNKILLKNDPGYLANLKAMPTVEREQLLHGNWKIRPASGLYFPRHKIEIIEQLPKVQSWCRAWDLAATIPTADNPSPDATAGVLMGRTNDGRYIIADVQHKKIAAADVRKLVKLTAQLDKNIYKNVKIRLAQDPGQAGKEQIASYIKFLSGFVVVAKTVNGDKITRAEPLATQWQQGNVLLLKGEWNDSFLSEMEAFPPITGHDDQVDAASDAFSNLQTRVNWGGYK